MENARRSTINRIRGKCIINGCVNHISEWIQMPVMEAVSYYRIPEAFFWPWKAERRSIWIQAIIRHNKFDSDWQPTRYTYLCDRHFVGGKKSEHPLHPAYNPTLFPSQKDIVERASQHQNRQNLKRRIVEDPSESEEPSSATLESEPEMQRRKTQRTETVSSPVVVLLREKFVEDLIKREEDRPTTSDFECQAELDECEPTSKSLVNCLMCNLKVNDGMNCAETQVNMKKNEYVLEIQATSLEERNILPQKINFIGISSLKFESNVKNMCGINFKTFSSLLRSIPDNPIMYAFVSSPNRLLITLIKLRQGLSDASLSMYFTMQQSLIRKVINEILLFLKGFAADQIVWMEREVIQNYMPEQFKPEYSNCRAMIDCVEIQVELPQNAEAQKEYYKIFKNCDTFKILIACAPDGYIMYNSKCYNGQNDGFIAHNCGFLDFVESGDVILTDREFPSLKVAISDKGATLKKIDATTDSDLYFRMKGSLSQLKHFKILSAVPMELLKNIDSIVQICCSLVNSNSPMSMPENA